jgi:ferredoxin--NADP+ reductase
VEKLLQERAIEYVTYKDWLAIDKVEQELGQALNRPRVKFSRVDELLNTVREHKAIPAGD